VTESVIIIYILTFARCWGFFAVIPQLGELEMPTGVKMIIIACITPFVSANQYLDPHLVANHASIIPLLAKEVLLGLFIGFLVSLPLRLPQLLGDMIDNQRGAAVTSQFNPALGEDSSILGQLLLMCLLTYFYTEGGFDRFIGILSGTFALQPVTSYEFAFGDNIKTVAFVVINNYMHLFAILALPLMLVMFLTDFALGMSSKFAQSLNVFSLSQSIKAVVALAMVIAMHPKMMDTYFKFFNEVEDMFL
jgi:type III secretion protein T